VTETISRVGTAALRVVRGAAGYLGAVMGADAYDRYREHLGARHPDAEPMTERQFWREHQDWQNQNPQGRCC
jgi:uncharacterized short protein YbdD (DUF466 family)